MSRTIAGFTFIRSQRALTRFEEKGHATYQLSPKQFPCFARIEIAADENGQTFILERSEVEAMAAAFTNFNNKQKDKNET